jgi:hypothetical protein
MIKKTPTPLSWLFPIGTVILILFFISINLFESRYTDTVYRVLHSPEVISRIDMRIIAAADSAISRDTVIVDREVLQKFNKALAGGKHVSLNSTRMHSVFIDMHVYKNKKVNISVLKMINSGWVIGVGDDYYRNDSLVNLLTPYLSAKNP